MLTAIIASNCTLAQDVTITKTIGDFNQIAVSGFYDVQLVKENSNTVTITGPEYVTSQMKAEVVNNVLKIYTDKNINIKRNTTVVVKVPYSTLKVVKLTGSGTISSNETLTDDVTIELSGSGEIKLAVNCKETEALVTGSGEIILSGTTQTYDCKVTGSGGIQSRKLNADDVRAEVTGSGNINLVSNKTITGKITGSGNVDYSGNPTKNDIKVIGSGNFSKSR